MAMELSPERLREAQFAEVWRGYRMEEVRDLLDDAADALEGLEARARAADERAAVAERRLVERAADDEVSRTLVLAQRTADAAVREAEAEAARLLRDADERSRAMLAEVERRAEQLESEVQARAEAELRELSDRRAALEADVAMLADYVEQQRATLADELRRLVSWLDRAGHLDAPPVALTGAPATAGVDGTTDAGSETREGSAADSGRGRDHPWAPPSEPLEAQGTQGAAASDHAHHDGDGSGGDEPDADGPAPSEVAGAESSSAATTTDRTAGVVSDHDDVDSGGDGASPDSDAAGAMDDDPFLAELRRAVEDPEPLGPRDDDTVWADEAQFFDQDNTGSGRFRRRRR